MSGTEISGKKAVLVDGRYGLQRFEWLYDRIRGLTPYEIAQEFNFTGTGRCKQSMGAPTSRLYEPYRLERTIEYRGCFDATLNESFAAGDVFLSAIDSHFFRTRRSGPVRKSTHKRHKPDFSGGFLVENFDV